MIGASCSDHAQEIEAGDDDHLDDNDEPEGALIAAFGGLVMKDALPDEATERTAEKLDQVQRAFGDCLLYTSDAADERSSVDLGGRRIIKKKNNNECRRTRWCIKEHTTAKTQRRS